jgi:hypothetical protein
VGPLAVVAGGERVELGLQVGEAGGGRLGSSAANRIHDDFGRLRGSATTSPCRVRYRLTVAAETLTW